MPGPYDENERFTPYEPGTDPQADEEAPQPAPVVPYAAAQPAAPTAPVAPVAGSTRRGRGAMVLGGAGMAIAAVAAVVGLAIHGAADDGARSSGGSGSRSGDTTLYTNDLVAGECLIGAGFDPNSDDPVTGMQEVDCATAHDAEVLQINVLDSTEAKNYDIDDDSQIQEHCRQFLDPDQKQLLRDDRYFLLGLTETAHPVTGDHVACLLVRANGGPLHGQLG